MKYNISLILFLIFLINSTINSLNFNDKTNFTLKFGLRYETSFDNNYIFFKDVKNYQKSYFLNFSLDDLEKYEFKKKEENLFRRAEILFFGSLTIVSFAGWLSFSIYNVVIYGDTFGNLKRDQFLILYGGSAVISFSVAITDLLIQLKPKIKDVEIY